MKPHNCFHVCFFVVMRSWYVFPLFLYVRLTCRIYPELWWFESGQKIYFSWSKFHLRECGLRVGSLWKHGLINVSLMVFRKFLNSPQSIVISSFHFILVVMPSRVTEKTMLRGGCASDSARRMLPRNQLLCPTTTGSSVDFPHQRTSPRSESLASMADAWTQLAVSLSLPTGSTPDAIPQ